MKFRKIKCIFLFFALFLLSSAVLADVSTSDKTHIQNKISSITASVNTNDVSSILILISPNAKLDLRGEIEINLAGKDIQFRQSVTYYEDLGNNQVKVKTRFAASGSGWNVNELSNYYIFEKSGNSWLLVDTNFHQKLGPEYVLKIVGIALVILVPISLAIFAFWLWMLVDATTRKFDNKTIWIILILLLNIFGALLYFFIIKERFKKS